MFILDAPYVSEFLKQTVLARKGPALDNPAARAALGPDCPHMLPSDEFADYVRRNEIRRIYSNSENAINWIDENLGFTPLPRMINLCKDKYEFRRAIKELRPDYFFRAALFEELDAIDPAALPLPVVVKPAVGFFSLGVHKADTPEEWREALSLIKSEVGRIQSFYPEQVLNLSRFIIEQCIEGEEFAVDVYFDSQGRPVVLNILAHLFASDHDVSDRVYITSPGIIKERREGFESFLADIGRLTGLRDFPAHVELRVDDAGRILPIEVNPMRFAGWCVADLTRHAYGFNPYEYYLDDRKPDWSSILPSRRGQVYGVVVADLPPDLDPAQIQSVDYDALAARFTNLLELRRIDYAKHNVLAFIFAQAPETDLSEFKYMLGSDLREFLRG